MYQVTISCITLRVFFLESLHTPFWGCDYIYAGFLHFQQTSNGHLSPAKEFPELGKTLIRFLRKEVGEVDLHPKNPMFAQDFEHILDTVGLDTPAAMQRKRIR